MHHRAHHVADAALLRFRDQRLRLGRECRVRLQRRIDRLRGRGDIHQIGDGAIDMIHIVGLGEGAVEIGNAGRDGAEQVDLRRIGLRIAGGGEGRARALRLADDQHLVGEVELRAKRRADRIEHRISLGPRVEIVVRPRRPQPLIVGRDDGIALAQPAVEIGGIALRAGVAGGRAIVADPHRAVRPRHHRPAALRRRALRQEQCARYGNGPLPLHAVGGGIKDAQRLARVRQPVIGGERRGVHHRSRRRRGLRERGQRERQGGDSDQGGFHGILSFVVVQKRAVADR